MEKQFPTTNIVTISHLALYPSFLKGQHTSIFIFKLIALYTVLLSVGYLTAIGQCQPTQTPTVGVVMVQFKDHATIYDERGSVGFSAKDQNGQRTLIENKYRYQDYWNYFFQTTGTLLHPDSITHSDSWPAPRYNLGYYGSLTQWLKENSSGIHQPIPYSGFGKNGILNNVGTDGVIDWLTLDISKPTTIGDGILSEVRAKLWSVLGISSSLCDIIFVVYSGVAAGSFITQPLWSNSEAAWVIIPEKTRTQDQEVDEQRKNAVFNYRMDGVAHEYIHAFTGLSNGSFPLLGDYNYDPGGKTWLPFTVMGNGGGPETCPLHLTPWEKLILGWLDYEVLPNGITTNYMLPIVEKTYQNCKPKVTIVSIDNTGWPGADNPDWRYGHYLIIENRRAVGFDQYVTVDNNGNQISPGSTGGFLVWEYDESINAGSVTPLKLHYGRLGLSLIEADGKYEIKHGVRRSSADDFFSSEQVLSTWTIPGIVATNPASIANTTNYHPAPRSKNKTVTIKFGEYTATSTNENVIPYIAVDQPHTNTYHATEYNNQRKIHLRGNEGAMVSVSHLDDDEGSGLIVMHVTSDGGNSWTQSHLVNNLELWDAVNNEYKPQTTTKAKAPTIEYFDGDQQYHVAWQDKQQNGKYKIKIWSPQPGTIVTVTDEFECTSTEPLPALSYGYQNGSGNIIAKIVYVSDAGLQETISTDNGQTWSTPSLINGSGLFTSPSRPSLAMFRDQNKSINNEILVFKATALADGKTHIWYRVNNGAIANLTRDYLMLSEHDEPSVALRENIAHPVWTSTIFEKDPTGSDVPHRKAVHITMEIAQPKLSNPAFFFNRKYDRAEESQAPVIAFRVISGASNDLDAAIMWSVKDPQTGEGSRLRFSRFMKNPNDKYDWQKPDRESQLSFKKTRFPSISGTDGDARYVVVHGDEKPYRLNTRLISQEPPEVVPWLGDRDIQVEIFDRTMNARFSGLTISQPVLSGGQQPTRAFDIAGIPALGFDGTITGPSLSELTLTEKVLLHQSEGISWDIAYKRDTSYANTDSVQITGLLLDGNTHQVIGTSGVGYFKARQRDTSITLGFELPPSHYPSAEVKVAFELQNGAIDDPVRYLSVLINNLAETAIPKHAERRSHQSEKDFKVIVYPQPASDRVHFSYSLSEEGDIQFTILNVLGQEVNNTKQRKQPGNHIFSLNTANLNPGLYIYRYNNPDGVLYGTFTVVR